MNARERLKQEVIEMYGGRCTCCGESHPRFLTVEHVYADGQQHRRVARGDIYGDLKHRRFPIEGITLLCWNCNMTTRFGEVCPHLEAAGQVERHVIARKETDDGFDPWLPVADRAIFEALRTVAPLRDEWRSRLLLKHVADQVSRDTGRHVHGRSIGLVLRRVGLKTFETGGMIWIRCDTKFRQVALATKKIKREPVR